MKKSIKISLVVIPLALLASLVIFRSQPEESVIPNFSETSAAPVFEVRVIVPRLSRPFAGILPDWVVKKFDGTPGELHFDNTSGGAHLVNARSGSLELKADDWSLLIETDGAGHITSGSHFVFPLALGGRHVRLDCPARTTNSYFNTRARPGSNDLAGAFGFEVAPCTNAESGKTSTWPSRPLTVRGSFVGQAQPASTKPTGPGKPQS